MDADCLLADDQSRDADQVALAGAQQIVGAFPAVQPSRAGADTPLGDPSARFEDRGSGGEHRANDAGLLRTPGGNLSRRRCVRGVALEPCREGAMTAWQVRARSRRAGALLGAIAVLVAGCTAPGGDSGLRADRAGVAEHSVATGPPGRAFGHRIAGTPGPGSVQHGRGPGIAGPLSPAQCAPPLGDPVVNRADAASRLPVVVPACLCCRWCACAWACCGCSPGRWPPRWWPPHSPLAWPCCPRWLGPPDGDSAPVRPCGPGCASHACPVGPARSAAGSVQARSPGGAAVVAG
jgi:hypothetical protein